jgi:CheY-like chemotaxis protein
MKNGKAVVLIVEDSSIILMGAVDLVQSAGYEAVEAQNADEAIRILESRNDIDLVFTDVQMPGTMDGIKLSHYIRDRWPPVRIMVASGLAILEESSLPTGSRFFAKPYNDTAITEMMAQMLAEDTGGASDKTPDGQDSP